MLGLQMSFLGLEFVKATCQDWLLMRSTGNALTHILFRFYNQRYDALLGCDGKWEELVLRGVIHGGDNDSTGTISLNLTHPHTSKPHSNTPFTC